jgi:hypothetical protein
MSISDEIERLCHQGKLHLLEPIGLRAQFVPRSEWRKLYVTADLAKYFESPQSLIVHADLHKDCRMARLSPARDDIWEIRIYDHNPQLRLFDRFARTDVFLALVGPVKRGEIKRKRFDRLKEECLTEWRRLFGLISPDILGSTDEHDYISKNVHVIDHH